MKKLALGFVVTLLLIGFNVAFANDAKNGLATQQFMINGALYQLEIARTQQQLQKGLMARTALGKQQGMLLVFPQFRRQGIWMKGMLIPLTVAWLDTQLNVVAVHKLLPCQTQNCPITLPKEPAAYVLELPFNNAIKVGDQLLLMQ